MASSIEYVEYVCEKFSDAGNITYKKMFGEYCVYCDLKPIGLVCNDIFFLKPTDGNRKLAVNEEMGCPYNGAKPHIMLDNLEDAEYITEIIVQTYKDLPIPKPKKTKN